MMGHKGAYEIKMTVGVEKYDQGKKIFDKGGVGPIVDLGHNLSYAEIKDGKDIMMVSIRSFPDDHEPNIECDCHEPLCKHITALWISGSVENISEDDPDVIAELEEDIDNLYDDIVSDDDYDEDANSYEDWEIERYGLSNDNDSVEYDYTYDLCERIVSDVSNPVTALRLFDRLHRASYDFEYDNGGFDDAVSKFDKELKALFTYADPEVTAEILTSGSNYSGSWGEKYIEYIPKGVLEKSQPLIGKQGTLNRTGLEVVLGNGDYDTYIDRSHNKEEAYLTVIKEMRSKEDSRIREYAKVLCDMAGRDSFFSMRVADEIWDLGFEAEAAEVYSRSFVSSPDIGTLNKLRMVADKVVLERTLDDAVAKHLCGKGFDIRNAACLASCGRCREVEEFIRKENYEIRSISWNDKYAGAVSLCRVLVDNGYMETAVRIAHDTVSYYMNPSNAAHYSDGISMLRFLASEKKFEMIEPKHSVYLAKLREERKTMRKFWGMYDGTWVGKNDRRDRYW